MSASKLKYGIILFIIALLVSLIWVSGLLLDTHAEKISQEMYHRDENGVIDGLQSIAVLQDKKRALIFVHGFADSPASFAELIDDIKHKVNSDIYAPLLPFHGRDLRTLSQFNNKIILDDLDHTINTLAKKYQSLTVVGGSYGGALLTKLMTENKIPSNVHLILYAPGFFIQGNTYWGRTEVRLYRHWRLYCNYKILGCRHPGYQNGDATAAPMFDKERSLQYVVLPAISQLYQFDLENRDALTHIRRPYSVIMAVDDNRISYEQQKMACKLNQPYCHLYSFPSGKHIIHWGANKKKFESLLIKLVNKNGEIDRNAHQVELPIN